jgi:hypothetical protein
VNVSVKDQQAANAKKKKNYVDRKGAPIPVVGPRPSFDPKPGPTFAKAPSGRVAPVAGAPGLSPAAQRLVQIAAQDNFGVPETGGGGGGFNPFGMVGSALKTGFNTVLNVADTSRRAYQGFAGEVGDFVEGATPGNNLFIDQLANTALGNPASLRGVVDAQGKRDTNFDLGEIRRSVTGADAMGTGFLDRSPWTQDLPGVVKPVVGFAGDILTDPLTYVTAGTVKGALGGAEAAGRVALAGNTAEAVDAAIAGGKAIARETGDKLIKETGTRGLGALTTKGLKRSGATAQDLADIGKRWTSGTQLGSAKPVWLCRVPVVSLKDQRT